ncbi:MAG: HAMP domain-containing sensor histidine kinase [Thermodesulfobacteriota bacterium]
MFRNISLQVTLFFLTMMAGAIICSGGVLGWSQYRTVLEQQHTAQRHMMQRLDAAFSGYLTQLGQNLQMMADIGSVKGMDKAEKYIMLKSLHLQNDLYEDIIYLSKMGEAVRLHPAPENPAEDLFPETEILCRIAQGSTTTSYLFRQNPGGKPHIIIVAPISLLEKRFTNGALAAIILLEKIRPGGKKCSVDIPDGLAFFASDGKLLSTFSSGFPRELFPPQYFEKLEPVQTSIKNGTISGTTKIQLLSPSLVLAEAHSFITPWTFLFDEIRSFVFILAALFFAILIVGVRFVKLTLSRPLELLQAGTEQIRQGSYDHLITVKGNNEFQDLAAAFNSMSEKLSETFQQLNLSISRLEDEMRLRQLVDVQLQHSDKLASLGRLTGSVAHEFGNPVLGLSYLLHSLKGDADLDEKNMQLVDIGIEECDKIQDLIKKIRQLSQPSTENKKLVNLNSLVENGLSFNRKLLTKHDITLEKSLADDMEEMEAVEDQLSQVFFNLITNAVTAMNSHGGLLTVSTSRTDALLTVSFKDTGCGIDEENKAHIFDPFYSTKNAADGTGLGLYLAYNIVKNHGGTIEAFSSPGHGSTFVISFPRQQHQ